MIKKYIILFSCILALTSCEDFLSKAPDSNAELDTPDNIAALLVSACPNTSHAWFTDVMTDNVTDVGPGAPANEKFIEQAYNWETIEGDDQDTPDGYWYSCYSSIAAVNAALEAIDKLAEAGYYTSSELNPLKGEALMCRAYCHFMLVNLFAEHYSPDNASSQAGIPYVTEVETEPIVQYTRQSVEYVYNAIQKDFEEGYRLISDNSYSSPKWHFNKQASATFISRYFLYRGLDSDWDSVIYYANEALQGNPEAYLRDWLTTSEESFDVFGTNYSKSELPANFLIQSKVSSGYRAWYYRYTMNLELLRKRVVYGTPHPTKTSITNNYVFINKAGGNTTYGCYAVFKFVEEFKRDAINANYGIPYVMYTTVVAEEALFNLMEAYVMKENYDMVIELLNLYYSTRVIDYSATAHEVTDAKIVEKYTGNTNAPDITPHYSLTEKQKTYLKCIINIRASEFITEGQRWFDIKRMHMEIVHKSYDGSTNTLTANDSRRVISLPEDVGDISSDTEDNFNTTESISGDIIPSSYNAIMEENPSLSAEN